MGNFFLQPIPLISAKSCEFVIMSHFSENNEIPWCYLSISVITSSNTKSMYPLRRHLELPVIALIESLAPEPTRQGKTVEF